MNRREMTYEGDPGEPPLHNTAFESMMLRVGEASHLSGRLPPVVPAAVADRRTHDEAVPAPVFRGGHRLSDPGQ
jgi:hypothetical protein